MQLHLPFYPWATSSCPRGSNFLCVTDFPKVKLPRGNFHGYVKKNKRIAHDSSRGKGRFPFNQNFRFGFPGTSSSEWNSIFRLTAPVMTIFRHFQKRGQPREVYPNFRKKIPRKFSFHSTLLPEFLKFSIEWFAFRKFNSFRNFWKLFQELSVPFASVSKFSKVLVEWKAPKVYVFRRTQSGSTNHEKVKCAKH